jgi:hypothetical protein
VSGKCAGNRKPPCGLGKNCKGFEKGHRCGAHAPVGGCPGHGDDAEKAKRAAALDAMLAENASSFQVGKFWRAVG